MLRLLYEGRYTAAIAEELDLTKQGVHYHVKKLLEDGLVVENEAETWAWRQRLGGGTSIKIYGLTDEGLRVLQRQGQGRLTGASPGAGEPVKQALPHNAAAIREPRVEVHNFEVKVPVKRLGISWLPSAAEMNNWVRRWDPDFHGVYLEVTTKHLLLRAGAEGPDRATAEALCLRRLMRVLDLLERHYGCELGRPSFRCIYAPGRTKVGVLDHPLAKGAGYQEGRLATIDSTPEPDTIHPKDPNDADRIVRMARTGQETNELLRGLVEQQTAFFRGLSELLTNDHRPEPQDRPGDTMEVA